MAKHKASTSRLNKIETRKKAKREKRNARDRRRRAISFAVAAANLGAEAQDLLVPSKQQQGAPPAKAVREASKKRRKTKPAGLQIYWHLASVRRGPRETAAVALVSELTTAQKAYLRAQGGGKKGLKKGSEDESSEEEENESEEEEEASDEETEDEEESGEEDEEEEDEEDEMEEEEEGEETKGVLKLEGCCDEITYAVKRLIRGLESSRGGARQGYSVALAACLRALPSLHSHLPAIAAAIPLLIPLPNNARGKVASEALFGRMFAVGALISSSPLTPLKFSPLPFFPKTPFPQDASEALFGRMFALGSLIRSGLLASPSSLSSTTEKPAAAAAGGGETGWVVGRGGWLPGEVVSQLLRVGEQRSFLAEPATVLLVALISQETKITARKDKERAFEAALTAVSGHGGAEPKAKKGRMEDWYGEGGKAAKRAADDAICLFITGTRSGETICQHPLFLNMLRAVNAAGTSYVPPKRGYVGGAGLLACKQQIEKALTPITKTWKEIGMTIASDMMRDKSGRAQMNILCINASGAVFQEAVDCKAETKSGAFIMSVLQPVIEKVGPEHVVAICTDGGSNYVSAAKRLQKKYSHIEFVPCATHVLNLLSEDFGSMAWAQEVVPVATDMISFIRSHTWTHAFLRCPELHGEEKSLQPLRPAGTRFGT
ncbi:unnamed protein product [Closterium sp. NIES-64]|nr:unnamed protein product [Closterium sp. NIES-64]